MIDGCFELYSYPQGCPTCGADSYVIELKTGNWTKFVGVCICCPAGGWTIMQGTHAFKAFLAKKKDLTT